MKLPLIFTYFALPSFCLHGQISIADKANLLKGCFISSGQKFQINPLLAPKNNLSVASGNHFTGSNSIFSSVLTLIPDSTNGITVGIKYDQRTFQSTSKLNLTYAKRISTPSVLSIQLSPYYSSIPTLNTRLYGIKLNLCFFTQLNEYCSLAVHINELKSIHSHNTEAPNSEISFTLLNTQSDSFHWGLSFSKNQLHSPLLHSYGKIILNSTEIIFGIDLPSNTSTWGVSFNLKNLNIIFSSSHHPVLGPSISLECHRYGK